METWGEYKSSDGTSCAEAFGAHVDAASMIKPHVASLVGRTT